MTDLTVPMTEGEAATWKMKVGNTADQLRVLLFEGYERRAWAALGHASWTECIRAIAAEYEFSEQYMWKLHAANETESLLTPGSVGEIPERVLRPLTALPPALQPGAYQKAVEISPNGKPPAAIVQRVVVEYDEQAEEPSDVVLNSILHGWVSR